MTEFFLVNRAVAGTDAQQLHLKIATSAIPVRYSTTEFFFHLFQTILCGGTELVQHGCLLCNGVDRCAALDTPHIIGGAGTYRWLDLVQFIHESTQQLNGTGVAKICIGMTTGRFTGDLIPIRTHGTAAAKRHIDIKRIEPLNTGAVLGKQRLRTVQIAQTFFAGIRHHQHTIFQRGLFLDQIFCSHQQVDEVGSIIADARRK